MAFGAEVAELIVALRLDDKGFSGKLNSAAGQVSNLGRNLQQMGRGAGQVGQGVGKIVDRAIIGAAAGLTGVITTAASFEQAWAGVTKTVEGANEDLRDDFEDLSRKIPLSFEELAAIGAEGGALGIATKDLIEFTDIVARLSVSTDLTSEQASAALGQLGNVLHLSAEDMHDFGDSLVALGNDGASTESQILDMAARFGAAGKQAGLSNEAILALASTTASMGIEAEAGGGALSRVFNGITVDIANASDESKSLADAMGLSLGELRTAWDQDAGAVFGDLLGYINQLDKFEAAQFLGELGITNTRDINAIMLLASGVDEYQRQLGVAEGQTDELNKESQAFFDTTEGKWEILKNNVRLVGDQIGSKLLPIVNELADEFITWLSDPKVQKGIEDFAVGLADGIRDVIKQIKEADFGPLLDTLRGAADIAKAGFDAFNALPSGVKSLALAAFGINKLTGGALGDIAKGFSNIFAGGLKILFERGSPTNPMWVKSIDGGLGGLGGAAGGAAATGGGLLRNILRFVPVVLAAELANELEGPLQDFTNDSKDWLKDNLGWEGINVDFLDDLQWPFGPKGAPEWAGGDAPAPWDTNAPATPTGQFSPTNMGGTPAGNGRSVGGDFGPKGLDTLTRAVQQLPDTAMMAEGFSGVESSVDALPSILGSLKSATMTTLQRVGANLYSSSQTQVAKADALSTLARSANAYQSRTASATEVVSRKNFSPTLHNNITIPVNVKVNTSVIQKQISTLRTTTGSGGFI